MKKFLVYLFLFLLTPIVNSEIVLDANNIFYDTQKKRVTATGDVIVIQTFDDGTTRELHSEKIEYNKKTGDIKLIGESIIKEPTGDIISSKNVELDKEFKDAIADALTIILKDTSKIKGKRGIKSDRVFTLENATYSPCKESGCSAPLWDLAAEKAIYDKVQKKFIYKNVKLRIKGIPVFFTPYFSHPSPDVKRKTGFLTPMFRNLTDVGFFAGFPFYAAISPNKDLRFTPFLNSKKRALVSADYRQLFHYADFDISTSFLSRAKKKEFSQKRISQRDKKFRWHFDSVFKTQNLDNKCLSFRINRASDVTYKTIYPVDLMHNSNVYLNNKYNDSNIKLDLFNNNYFLNTSVHWYQTNDRKTAPFIAPYIDFNTRGYDFLDGQLSFSNNTVYLTRDKEKSTLFAKDFFRTSNTLKWEKNKVFGPFLFELNSALRTDIFNVSESETAEKSKNKIFPIFENQCSLSVPLISKIKSLNQKMIWSPKLTLTSVESNNERANFEQNEDSIFDNFSDLTLHTINRFGGYDRIENGERVSIGAEASIYNSKRRWLNAFIGKSNNLGNRQKVKDQGRNSMVGRLVLKPWENISLRARFIGIPFIEKSQLFESGINTSYKKFFGGIGYLYDKKINCVQENGISQLGINCGFRLTNYWSISGSKIFNMKKKNGKGSLTQGVTASYGDECLNLGIGVFRTNFKDNDIKPRTGFILTIIFKNLGNLIKSNEGYAYNNFLGHVE